MRNFFLVFLICILLIPLTSSYTYSDNQQGYLYNTPLPQQQIINYNTTINQINGTFNVTSNYSNYSNFWDNIDTPLDFSQARFSDNISIGNASTKINRTRITTDELFADNICYSDGTNCTSGGTETNWNANYTNMLVNCSDGNYNYGIYNNGSFKCRNDRTILSSNLYASTITDYTQIFVIPLTPNKINIIQIYLVQNSSTIIKGVQNKANLSSANGPGTCKYITMSNLGEFVAPVILTTTTADSNALSSFLEPTLNIIECSILTNVSSTNLIISFQPETAGTVQTFAGSYYTMVVY